MGLRAPIHLSLCTLTMMSSWTTAFTQMSVIISHHRLHHRHRLIQLQDDTSTTTYIKISAAQWPLS
jgi:hypothetical protein